MNTTLTPADLDPRRQAMLLYFQGYRVARIAEMLGEKVATVHSWKKRDKWGDYGPLDQMQLTTAARYCQLIMKEHKEGKDFKEIDLLARQSERHARIGKFNNGGNEADLNPNVANRNKGPRRQPEKNVFTDEQIEKLEEIFHSSMFNVTVISIANLSGRLVLGILSDKIARIRVITIGQVISLVGMAVLLFAPLNAVTFFAAIACVAFNFGGTITVFPSLVSEFFGLNNLAKNYGVIYLGFGIGSICGSIIASLFGGFYVTFYVIFALLILSLALSTTIRQPEQKMLREAHGSL